jgi:hypothetical protein
VTDIFTTMSVTVHFEEFSFTCDLSQYPLLFR